jgi:crossover junction endodeoxyribonuclease RuvC
MLVIGIDPGIAITGYGLIQENSDGSVQCVDYGVIRTPADEAPEKRLLILYEEIGKILLLHHPACAGVEKLFFQHNVKTAMAVGQARGVAMLALAQAHIEVSEYTPNEVKQSLTGYGAAKKDQVQQMVKTVLNLPEIPQPDDAADALAVAFCHLNCKHMNDAVKDSES